MPETRYLLSAKGVELIEAQGHTFDENLAICLARLLLSAVLLNLLRVLVLWKYVFNVSM